MRFVSKFAAIYCVLPERPHAELKIELEVGSSPWLYFALSFTDLKRDLKVEKQVYTWLYFAIPQTQLKLDLEVEKYPWLYFALTQK